MANALRPRLLASCAALLALAELALAADHFVGPGHPHADVSSAIAAAAPGDRIFVAPGLYPGFDLSKPVEIRGAGVGQTRIGSWVSTARTTVTGIPAGSTATLANMSFDPAWYLTQTFGPQLTLVDNPGTVLLQDVGTNLFPTAWHIGTGVEVDNTARLLIQGSTIEAISTAGFPTEGVPALVAKDSFLEVTDSVFVATASGVEWGTPGEDGVRLENCTARFARVRSSGGNGTSDDFFDGPGGAGVKLIGSTLELAGGPENRLEGGSALSLGGPGLDVTASSAVVMAGDVELEGGTPWGSSTPSSSLRVDGSSSSVALAHALPALVPAQSLVSLGGPWSLSHTGDPGALVIPVLGASLGAPLALPGFGGFAQLDLGQLGFLPTLSLDGAGQAVSAGLVPNQASLAGAHAWFQAAEVAGGVLSLSNATRLAIAN